MRDHLLLYVNGRRRAVSGRDAFLSLSDYLRYRLGLAGTKIVCSEGDCGSCTVLIGRPSGRQFEYRPIDSCIQWMFQLDGTHVVTVEGLAGESASRPDNAGSSAAAGGSKGLGPLTPVQEAMVRCHGSQCGFCTPGFVVAMTGLLEDCEQLDEASLRYGLTGNLCRCTGYVPIIEAGVSLENNACRRMNELYPPSPLLRALASGFNATIAVEASDVVRTRRFFSPTSLVEALKLLQVHTNAKVVAGATDVGVQLNKGVIDPDVFLDLNRVSELTGVEFETNGGNVTLVAGARTTWSEIEDITQEALPEFHNIVSIFGSPQIRHVGTIGGNIVNASPIADSLPLMFVAEAELEIAGAGGTRRVPITNFYRGYKQLDLNPGELLVRVHIPLPPDGTLLRLVKVSRRRDLDIATFTAAIWLELDGDTIREARIAFGAVGPTVLRAQRTESFLRGQRFTEDAMCRAGDIAVGEITPISDVRGGADFRYRLARNVLVKFYHEQTPVKV